MQNRNNFWPKFKIYLYFNELNLYKVAKSLGIPYTSLTTCQKKEQLPPEKYRKLIADFIGISLEDLINDNWSPLIVKELMDENRVSDNLAIYNLPKDVPNLEQFIMFDDSMMDINLRKDDVVYYDKQDVEAIDGLFLISINGIWNVRECHYDSMLKTLRITSKCNGNVSVEIRNFEKSNSVLYDLENENNAIIKGKVKKWIHFIND